jgi:hypothetical protein
LELDKILQSLPNGGSVKILKTIKVEDIIFDVEFLTNNGKKHGGLLQPLPIFVLKTIWSTVATPHC